MEDGVRGLRNILFAILFSVASVGISAASDIYVAQNAAGGNTGADCADAHAATWFNTQASWGGGSGQISPGTTVHVCGTFVEPAGMTGVFVFRGSGSAGNPITLLFESGAALTAPYWGGQGSSAVIQASGLSYLTVDGGTNGLITATANGTSLANHQDTGTGVSFVNVANSEVKNLHITNLYVHTKVPDDPNGGSDTYAIYWYGGSNIAIDNNQFNDVASGVWYGYPGGTTSSNIAIGPGNVGFNSNHPYTIGGGNTNAILNGTNLVHDNVAHDFVNWDTSNDAFHHDGIFIFAVSSGDSISGLQIYNNYIYGDTGFNGTAAIFLDNEDGCSTTAPKIFNNVLTSSGSTDAWGNSFIDLWASPGAIVANNTVVGSSNALGVGFEIVDSAPTTAILKNNIFSTLNVAIYLNSGTLSPLHASDYNNFYNNAEIAQLHAGANYNLLTTWQAASSGDSHSQAGDPKLNASSAPPYQFADGSSAAFQTGANLGSLGIAALALDKAGNSRPLTSPPSWTIGAYSAAGNSPTPDAPSGLSAAVQ